MEASVVKIMLLEILMMMSSIFFLSLSKLKLLPNATESLNQEVVLGEEPHSQPCYYYDFLGFSFLCMHTIPHKTHTF